MSNTIGESMHMRRIPFSGIRRIFDEAHRLEQQGRDIIHLEIGRPDFDTPAHIKQAAKEAIDRGVVHYTANSGTIELRRAIANKLERDNELEYDPNSEVIVTVGVSEGAFCAMAGFLNSGDEVLVPSVGWVNYATLPELEGAIIKTYPVRAENGFRVSAADIESEGTERTKMLILISPGNPTGAVIAESELVEIAKIAHKHNLLVLSDEIYEKIIYGEAKHASIAAQPGMRGRSIVLNGFSKAYSMTGWRLGYVAATKELIGPMLKAHQYVTTCAVSFAQAGAVAALEGPQDCVSEMVAEFKRRRDMLVPALNKIQGVKCTLPQGAFYAFADVSAFGMSSQEVTYYLLREAGIAVVPGSTFGPTGEGFIRISFANSYEKIKDATERMAQALAKLQGQGA